MQNQLKTFSFRIFFFFLFVAGLLTGNNASAQQKKDADSARKARQHVVDSTTAARKHSMDSARIARQKITDSLSLVRKHKADSVAAIRKYRESRKFKDSVAHARKQVLDSIKSSRTAFFDSLKSERQRVTDSAVAARKHTMDSVRAFQKHRADSLMAIRKYRESKRFQDSVQISRQMKLDSTRESRKAINEQMAAARKRSLDSAAAIRKVVTDSMTAARKKYTDSLAAVRKVRTDSLAKVKEGRERLKKSQEKQKEDKMKLALEIKIKKKQQAWSNEKMLKKKWSVPRRLVQNTFTRYNYYFNADRKMDEALDNMQRMKKENYDSLLALFPFNPDKDSTLLAADMDSIIQKASVGIQIHDPRTKWADDLYLLLGQAYYYKGNYEQASNSFRYIISMNQQRKAKEQKEAAAKKKTVDKELSIVQEEKNTALDFLKHKTANNEAILWLARTYTQSHKETEAESVLDLLESDKNLPDNLNGRIAVEKAYLNLQKKNYTAASDQLAIVADNNDLPDWIRIRAAYLNGQLLYQQGNYASSAEHFQKVIDMHPKIDMDFYARKNLAYGLIEKGGSQESATASLKRMLNDSKYGTYHEQVYYILGRLSANSNNLDDAITYLKKSIESPKSTKKQKAVSFADLGNVYYSKGDYKAAKLAYDSASYLAKYAPNDPQVQTAAKRGKVLDMIVIPVQIINDQDSLLTLASMSEKDQRAIVRRYIKYLENRRADSIARAEKGDGEMQVEDSDPGGGGNVAANTSWYFSNPALMQQGFNDFKRKWGNRPNVDNWRRAAGSSFASSVGTVESGDDDNTTVYDDKGLPTEESLLAAIPKTPEKQTDARQRIQKAYVDLATAYVKELEDYPRGTQTLDTLDKRFPNHDQKAEALFVRYLIALQQNQLDKAKQLSQQLMNQHAGTEWAKRVAPSSQTEGLLASNVPVAKYYDETYGMMMQRQYGDVLARVRNGQMQYNDPVFKNRFRIMEAIALAGSGNYGLADTMLTEFISTHPTDSLRPWAEMVMNFVKKSKPVIPKDTASKNVIPDSTLSNLLSEPATTPLPPPANYTYKPKDEHYFLFSFPKMESKAMGVKAALSDFNTFNFSSQKLNANLEMLQESQGIVVIKSFPSLAHARIYMNSVRTNNLIFKEYKPEEYQLMVISADNFRKLEADKNILPYVQFYKANYK